MDLEPLFIAALHLSALLPLSEPARNWPVERDWSCVLAALDKHLRSATRNNGNIYFSMDGNPIYEQPSRGNSAGRIIL